MGKGVKLVLVVEEAPLGAFADVLQVGPPAVDVIGGGLQGPGGKLHVFPGGNPPQPHHVGVLVADQIHLVVLAAAYHLLAVQGDVNGAVGVGGVGDIGVLGQLIQKEVALVVQLVGSKVGVGLDGGRVVHNGLVQPGNLANLLVHLVHRNLQVVDLLLAGAVELGADLLEGLGDVFHRRGHNVGVGLRVGVDRKGLEGVAEGHHSRPQAGVVLGVKLVDGSLDIPQDVAGLVVVAHIAAFLPVALIQKGVPDLADAGDVHTLAGGPHPAGGIAVAVAVRGDGHLGDALAGVAVGIPVHQVLAGDVQALLGGGKALFGRLKS